jgi:hypothetical protein
MACAKQGDNWLIYESKIKILLNFAFGCCRFTCDVINLHHGFTYFMNLYTFLAYVICRDSSSVILMIFVMKGFITVSIITRLFLSLMVF